MKRNLLIELDPGGEPVREIAVSQSDADLLCAAAGERGHSAAVADLAGCCDRKSLLTRIAEALEFPDSFSGTWDAFFDCLADLGWLPAGDHVLVILNTDEMRRDAPEAFDTARSMMRESAAVWQKRGRTLRVIMDRPAARTKQSTRSPRKQRKT